MNDPIASRQAANSIPTGASPPRDAETEAPDCALNLVSVLHRKGALGPSSPEQAVSADSSFAARDEAILHSPMLDSHSSAVRPITYHPALVHANIFSGMYTQSYEMTVLLLKPGVGSRVRSELLQRCSHASLRVIAERSRIRLTPETFSRCFYRPFKPYSEYMCSGPIEAFLVGGEDAVNKANWIKSDMRLCRGLLKNEYKNLVHSTDDGLEFAMQAAEFFPGAPLALHADLAVAWPVSLTQPPGDAAVGTRPKWLGLQIPAALVEGFQTNFPRVAQGLGSDHACLLAILVPHERLVLSIFVSVFSFEPQFSARSSEGRIDLAREGLGMVAINDMPEWRRRTRGWVAGSEHQYDCRLREEEEAVAELIRTRVPFAKALRTFGPLYDCFQSEVLTMVCARLGLIPWGGGRRDGDPRSFGMCKTRFESFVRAFPEYYR